MTVQQTLLEASGGTPMMESVRWIEAVILNEIAIGLSVIAMVFLGALMLTGRLPLREGTRIVVGSFILLGAPVIAEAFARGGSALIETSAPPPDVVKSLNSRSDRLPTNFDPYAGASLKQE